MPDDPIFEITTTNESIESTAVLAGFSSYGLAGLTAVDFLVDALELEECGHVTAPGLATIVPFEEGRPRHHTRLLSREDLDLTVLLGELSVPPGAGGDFANAVHEYADDRGVDEVTVLSGVPLPHGPDDHDVFSVASEDYDDARLERGGVRPLRTGFFDGVNAALLERGMGTDTAVGVYTTPVHQQVPDVEAALRLLEAATSAYELAVETEPLEAFAADVEQYYSDLAERLAAREEGPEDRMYM